MACWFRTTATTWRSLIEIADTGNGLTGSVNLGLSSSGAGIGALRVAALINGSNTAASTVSHSTSNVWEHAAAVFTSDASRAAFLNGGNKGTNSTSATPAALDTTRIGVNDFGEYMDGDVAEAAIWNVALDDAEIAALAKGVCPLLIRPTSLVAYWPLLNSAAPDVDRWNSRYDLTPTNAPTMGTHPYVLYPIQASLGDASLTQSISGSITPTGSLARLPLKVLAGSIAPAGSLLKQLARNAAGAIAPAGAVFKQTAKQFAGTISSAATLATLKVALRTITGSITPSGTIAKQANKVIAGVLTPAGSIVKQLARLLAGFLAPTGVLARQRITETTIRVVVGGTDITSEVDLGTLTKEESNDAITSNTCSFVFFGTTPPTELKEITVTRGLSVVEFAGTVLTVKQFYDGIRHNIGWRVSCQDFTWLFNKIRNSQKWSGAVSATTIATAIVGWDSSGFTTTNIEAGLPTVTDFEVIQKTRGEALKLLAEHVGATVLKVDYTLDVHFRVTPAAVNLPADITDVTKSGDHLVRNSESNQIRTRQRGLGTRVRIPSLIPSGSTAVAVESVDKLPASGQLQVGSRTLTFTGQTQTQTPSGITGVAAAPTVALASSPAGGVLGAVRYCVTFETPDGETPPGAQSAEVTGATLAAPAAGSASIQHERNASTGGSPLDFISASVTATRSGTTLSFTLSGCVVGTRVYLFGGATGSYDGMWTIGAVSGTTVSIYGVSAAGAASETVLVQKVTVGSLVGTYNYKFGWISPRGISALSTAFSVSPAANSTTITATPTQTTGGALTLTSTYYYYYTLVIDGGESAPAALTSIGLTGSNNAVQLAFPQLGNAADWHDFRVRGLRVYRGRANQQIPRLLVEFSRESLRGQSAFSGTWNYTDTAADTALGALPTSSIVGGAIGITTLPSWSDSRVTGLMILRTVAGGSTYYPVTTINNSSVTSFLDSMSDAELQQQTAQPATSFGGHTVSLSSIATLAGATARNIYRLLSGVWRYCGTIPNNTDTTFTDSKADTELGAPIKIGGYLTGIAALSADIVAGEVARLHVVRSDAAAAATVATAMGRGDGYFEGPVLDDDTLGQTGLEAACDAEIDAFGAALREVTFRSRDVNLTPGTTITFNLGGTTNIVGTFVIQRVVTTEMDIADGLNPLRTVTAGPVLHTYRKSLGA